MRSLRPETTCRALNTLVFLLLLCAACDDEPSELLDGAVGMLDAMPVLGARDAGPMRDADLDPADSSLAEPDATTEAPDASADAGPESDAATAPTSPCGECPAETPVCDEARETCVACLGDADCLAHEQGLYCVEKVCVACMKNEDCADPAAPRCDTATRQCVGCLAAEDCQGMTEGERSLDICDMSDRTCVQCTGTQYEACGLHQDGVTPLVCDSGTRRCSSKQAGTEVICGACVSDAECGLGMRCVQEVYDEVPLDRVCLWTVGADTSLISSCTQPDARPYSRRLTQVTSVDGEVVDVCAPVHTTCEGLGQFGVMECAVGDDDACGHPAVAADGMCRPRSPNDDDSVLRCTIPCSISDDCPVHHACNRERPSYCDLEADTCYTNADCDADHYCDERRCMRL